MEIRRVFRAGNSRVVSLPPETLKELGIDDGSLLSVELDRKRRLLILKPVVPGHPSGISEQYAEIVEGFIGEYDDALRELGK